MKSWFKGLISHIGKEGNSPPARGNEEDLIKESLARDILELNRALDEVGEGKLSLAEYGELSEVANGFLTGLPSYETLLKYEKGREDCHEMSFDELMRWDSETLVHKLKELQYQVMVGCWSPSSEFTAQIADFLSELMREFFFDQRVPKVSNPKPGDIDFQVQLISLMDPHLLEHFDFEELLDDWDELGVPAHLPHFFNRLQYNLDRLQMRPGRGGGQDLRHFFKGTPVETYLCRTVTIRMPLWKRFEHLQVCGRTGWGKTRLLQLMIANDMKLLGNSSKGEPCRGGFALIENQGDLFQWASHLARLDPDHPESLAEKVIIIDAADTDHLIPMNLFDLNCNGLKSESKNVQEKVLNMVLELYEYTFTALLEIELTAYMRNIFCFGTQMMFAVRGNLSTFLELLRSEEGDFFYAYSKLGRYARKFFETEFYRKEYRDTRDRIAVRLWGILANSQFGEMLDARRNSVDFFDIIASGKVLLVHNSKEMLQGKRAAAMGKFILANLMMAGFRMAGVPVKQRRAFSIYLDEAHELFSGGKDGQTADVIPTMLSQLRKYSISLNLFHQSLHQLKKEPGLLPSMMSCTATKIIGKTSASDAADFAKELNVPKERIMGVRKVDMKFSEFTCHIGEVTETPVTIKVPLAQVEKVPLMKESAYRKLVEKCYQRHAAIEEEEIEEENEEELIEEEEEPKLIEFPKPKF